MRVRFSRSVLFVALAGVLAVLAATGMALWGPLVERWRISQLEGTDENARAVAIQWLREWGTARAVPALLEEVKRTGLEEWDLHGNRIPEQFLAQEAFTKSERLPAVDALLTILDREPGQCSRALARAVVSRTDALRFAAGAALLRMGPRAAPAVPQILEAIDWSDAPTSTLVIQILGSVGTPARDALPILLDLLQKKPESVELARVAGRVAARADGAAFIALLEGPEPSLRRAALVALEQMGSRATAAATALEACLKDPDQEVSFLAQHALTSVQESRNETKE